MEFTIPSQPNTELERTTADEFLESNLFRLIREDVPSHFWPVWLSKGIYNSDHHLLYKILVKMFRSTKDDLCPIMKSCKSSDEEAQYEHLCSCDLCRFICSEFNFHDNLIGQQEFLTSYLVQNLLESLASLRTNKVQIHLFFPLYNL